MTETTPHTSSSIAAFKGFTPTDDGGLRCRGVVYRPGETFTHDGDLSLCHSGIHATLMPIHVLRYYRPATSVFHVVELDGVSPETTDKDSKVVARQIKIGTKLSLAGLIEAQVEYVTSRAKPARGAHTKVKSGAATASGRYGAATASGWYGAATASGWSGAATASGRSGAATASGDESLAVTTGKDGRARGALGAWLVLAERDVAWKIIGVHTMPVDGTVIKPDVFYTIRDGQVVEA